MVELLFRRSLLTSSPLCKCHTAVAFSCQERNVLLETHTALLHEQRFNFKPLIRVICTEAAGNVFKLDKNPLIRVGAGLGACCQCYQICNLPLTARSSRSTPVPGPTLPPSTLLLQETTLGLLGRVEQTQGVFFHPLQKERLFPPVKAEGFGLNALGQIFKVIAVPEHL